MVKNDCQLVEKSFRDIQRVFLVDRKPVADFAIEATNNVWTFDHRVTDGCAYATIAITVLCVVV